MTPRGNTFPARLRLRRKREFDRVYRQRASASDGVIAVYAAANQLSFPRLGISVSRRIGTAVVRNRWKRLIREIFRLRRGQLPTGFDLVIVVRRPGLPDYQQLGPALEQLAHRAARRVRGAK